MNLAITQRIISFTKTLIDDLGLLQSDHGCEVREIDYWDWLAKPKNPPQVVIVDLRSPGEFAKGAIPGAINIPLLDNSERHEVGLTYKNLGQEEAIGLGLRLFRARASGFVADFERALGPDADVMIHCWRGGLRSQSVGHLLTCFGRNVFLLKGGYKGFRRGCLAQLETLASHPKLIVNGRTGVGKTEFLQAVSQGYGGVLDLEALAGHRGSIFGDFGVARQQMTQQNFENAIACRYAEIAHSGRLIMEMEYALGAVKVPESLRCDMMASPMIVVSRDFSDRAARLEREYAGAWSQVKADEFSERLEQLQRHLTRDMLDKLKHSAQIGRTGSIVRSLLNFRYDRMYDRSVRRYSANVVASFNLTWFGNEAVDWCRAYVKGEQIA